MGSRLFEESELFFLYAVKVDDSITIIFMSEILSIEIDKE